MPKERRKHTPEFKREALNLISKQQLSVAEVSRRLGVRPAQTLPTWGARVALVQFFRSIKKWNFIQQLKHFAEVNRS